MVEFWDLHSLPHILGTPTKGQLISKCLFCIFNSPKKRTKQFNFSTISDAVREWAGWALAHLEFGRSINPIPTKRGRLCPLHY